MKIIEENKIRKKRIGISDPSNHLTYFKLINIGEQTLQSNDFNVGPILDSVDGILFLGNVEEIRSKLHEIVDQACDSVNGGKNE